MARSKTVERVNVGNYSLRLKEDGSIAIARKGSRISVTKMGLTKSGEKFIEVTPV